MKRRFACRKVWSVSRGGTGASFQETAMGRSLLRRHGKKFTKKHGIEIIEIGTKLKRIMTGLFVLPLSFYSQLVGNK
jgi:hypothetical protein